MDDIQIYIVKIAIDIEIKRAADIISAALFILCENMLCCIPKNMVVNQNVVRQYCSCLLVLRLRYNRQDVRIR